MYFLSSVTTFAELAHKCRYHCELHTNESEIDLNYQQTRLRLSHLSVLVEQKSLLKYFVWIVFYTSAIKNAFAFHTLPTIHFFEHFLQISCNLRTTNAQIQWRIQTRCLGRAVKLGGRQKGIHLVKYQRLSATIIVCHTKEVIFCRSKSGYFCWSNYAIFQGRTIVLKLFISLIQKPFETGPKQWASFCTSYTDLVYLQNVFKRYKSMLRASRLPLFSLSITKSVKNSAWNAFPTWLETERFFLNLEVTTHVPR